MSAVSPKDLGIGRIFWRILRGFNHLILLLSAKVLTSLYELGLTLLTRYQPFLLPLFLLLN